MKLNQLLLPLFSLLLMATSVQSQDKNVLLIIADDVGVGPVPNYEPSTTKATMPNLENLMSSGITFDNVWSSPTCSPSRSTILTGKYGFRTNVLNPTELSTLSTDETSLHAYIDEASNGAYAASLIGKWHLGGSSNNNPITDYPNQCGIDYFAGTLGGGVMDYYDWDLVEDEVSTEVTDYITTKTTDLAIDWITEQDQAWFCWVAYNAPHTPFHLPPANMHSQGDLPSDQASIDANPLPYYLAMLESVDFEIGRLLAQIPADELANTTIIFIGDNGTPAQVVEMPFTTMRSKGSLFQGGVHVPAIVSGAGVNRVNEREAALVNFSDLFATIVELTGTSLPSYEDSKSFAHLLENAGEGMRDCAYTEKSDDTNQSGWTARDATYKFINLDSGNQRFYNLIDDPYEQDNLLMGGGNLNATEQVAFDKLANVRNELMTPIDNPTVAEKTFLLAPNPAQTDLFITLHTTTNTLPYTMVNIAGQIVQGGLVQQGDNLLSIAALNAGIYFIKIGVEVQRFVVL